MAVKYTIPMRDDFDLMWRADIDIPTYSDDPIQLTGVGRAAMVAEWNGDVDDPYTPIINSKVTLQFYNEDNVDIVELQNLQDMEARVLVYRDNVLWWSGYVVPDGIQRSFQAFPYPVQLVATDGLALLTDIPFNGVTNWPLPVGISNQSPLAFVRYVLFNGVNLNNPLPIRWASIIESVEYEDDFFAGTMAWGSRGEAYSDFQGNRRSNMYVLENMVKSMGARLFQFDGKWHIMRINDIVGGSYNWKEIDTTYGPGTPPTLTTGTGDLVAELNPDYYPFVSENHIITTKPAATDVVVTYDHYQAENIIPNGSFDLWSSGILLYWGIDGSEPVFLSQHDSITGQPGNAVEIDFKTFASDPLEDVAVFTFAGRLPIDATLLFKRFTFGFYFLPLEGYPIETGTGPGDPIYGTIKWDTNPLRIRVSYKAKDRDGNIKMMFLNRWGYWGPSRDTATPMEVVNETQGVSFVVEFDGLPAINDLILVRFTHTSSPQPDVEYSYTVTSATAEDLDATLSAFAATISGATSTATTVTIPYPPSGPWTGMAGVIRSDYNVLPGNWIEVDLEGLRVGDISSVVFQGKGGNSEILVPSPGVLDGTDTELGTLKFELAVLEGQKLVLDDVWMRVDENNDIYQSINPASTRMSKRETVDIGISTSFSGFMHSNYMTSYSKSNEEFLVTDGKHESSMTGLLANAMLRFRNKPSQIFNGSIYTNNRPWMFHHIYEIETLEEAKFLPLQSKYNIETGIVDLVVIEGRDDENTFTENHYASNDVILSN